MSLCRSLAVWVLGLALAACAPVETQQAEVKPTENCPVELVVLGVAQDAGAPQIGNPDDPAWKDPSKKLYATSLGLLDHENGKRYLFEATPDIREQMQIMDKLLPFDGEGPYIDGIFLTHAHIGHYGGLMFLGRESMGAKGVPVYVMPRMKAYLETNGPWSQLVELGNIELRPDYSRRKETEALENGQIYEPGDYGGSFEFHNPVMAELRNALTVRARKVEHRDEFSETAAYMIYGPSHSVFFVPDIDSWTQILKTSDSDLKVWRKFPLFLKDFDLAFIDATFYDDNELPGRDMSQIPHPRVTESMDLIEAADDDSLKDKVRFIHINHTNPLRDKASPQFKDMTDRGFKLAYRGERFCL